MSSSFPAAPLNTTSSGWTPPRFAFSSSKLTHAMMMSCVGMTFYDLMNFDRRHRSYDFRTCDGLPCIS